MIIWGDVGYSFEGDPDSTGFDEGFDSGTTYYGHTYGGNPTGLRDGYASAPDGSSSSHEPVFGDQHVDDIEFASAMTDATAAYSYLAGLPADFSSQPTELGGRILPTGVYSWTGDAILTTGTLTLNGSSTDVWVFQIPGNLQISGGTTVTLTGGAKVQNVFWQVGSYGKDGYIGARVGNDPIGDGFEGHAYFQGTIFSKGDILIGRGSTLIGHAYCVGPYASGAMHRYSTYNHYDEYIGYTGSTTEYDDYVPLGVFGSLSILQTSPINFGASAPFGALAKTSITASPVTNIGGSVGVSNTPAAGGSLSGLVADDISPGTLFPTPGDPIVVTAMTAASSLATDLSGRDGDYDMRGQSLSGPTLPGGVYLIDDFTTVSGTINLDGRNDPSSIWIFQGGPLTTLNPGSVTFSFPRGGNLFQVYWRVGTVHLGAGVSFKGNVVASTGSCVFDAGAQLQGLVFNTGGSLSFTSTVVYREPSGHPVTSFVPGTLDPSGSDDEARSLATDGTNMYVFGFQGGHGTGVNNKFRIEKRLLGDGSLVAAFGVGGAVVEDVGTGEEIPRKILADSTSIYLIGSSEIAPLGTGTYRWRIEKRLKTDGSLDTTFGGGSGFITSTITGEGQDIAMDATNLYAVGEEDDAVLPGVRHIRVEKRLLTTGALVTGFWTGGVVTDTTFNGGARSITLTSTAMVLGAWSNTFGSAKDSTYQKRLLSDGSADITFAADHSGTQITTWSGGDDVIQSIVNDGTWMYALLSIEGAPGTYQWAIEKRDLATGGVLSAYDYLFDPSAPVTTPNQDYSCGQLVVHGGALWIAGNSVVGGDERWRIEKRSTTTVAGSLPLILSFNADGPTAGVVEINPTGSADKVYGIVYDAGILYSAGMDAGGGGGQWHLSALNR